MWWTSISLNGYLCALLLVCLLQICALDLEFLQLCTFEFNKVMACKGVVSSLVLPKRNSES